MESFRLSVFFVVLSLVISFFACSQSPRQTGRKLRVLTTIAPLYSYTKNIAGDAAYVENLIPSGTGPHEYSLSPADAKKVFEARVLIMNGVNLEGWLYRLTGPARQFSESHYEGREKPLMVDTSMGVDIMGGDPHIWLSPKNAIIQVKNIRDALIAADPDNSSLYAKNAEAYMKRLDGLDKDIRNKMATLKIKNFVAFHPAFAYFARDYGLKQSAVIQKSPETEPSPQHIAEVVRIIKSQGLKSIFTEARFSHKIVATLSDDLGLQVYSLDTLESGTLSEQWYEDGIKSNVRVLMEAMQ